MPLTAQVRESTACCREKVSGGFAGTAGWFDADGERCVGGVLTVNLGERASVILRISNLDIGVQ